MAHDSGGTGGSFGRYSGLRISEIEDRLRACEQEGGWRGFSAALRIVREQLESRSPLGQQQTLTIAVGILAMVGAGLAYWQPDRFLRLEGGILALLLLLIGVSFRYRNQTREAEAQRRQILDLAHASLRRIVQDPRFVLKDLQREHRETLTAVLKRHPDPELAALLSDVP